MEIINPNGKKTMRVSCDWLGRELTLEVNRVGFRSTSSVLVTYGDTVVLGSVVVGTVTSVGNVDSSLFGPHPNKVSSIAVAMVKASFFFIFIHI